MRYGSVRTRAVVSRRPATGADIPLLRELFADAHVELAVLPPDSRFVLVDMQFRAHRRRLATQFPNATHEIVVADGVDVGRVVFERCGEQVQLVDITISLGRRREGIATAVLREELGSAGRLRLQVWAGNTAVLAVCRHLGLDVIDSCDGVVTVATPGGAAASTSPPAPDRG